MFRIKKIDLFDNIILMGMYLQLVILEFWGFGQILNKVLALLVIVRIIVSSKRKNARLIIPSILVVMFSIGCMIEPRMQFEIAKSNFLMLFYSFIYLYYVCFLCRNRANYIDEVLEKMFWIFNLTMVANIIVLYIQITQPYVITAKVTSIEIDYLEDTISGLFAYGATHVVSLFTAFLVLYNFSYAKKSARASIKRLIMGYTWMLVGLSSIIALFNDNKAFFLLLPVILLVYWYADKDKKSSRLNRIILSISIFPVVMFGMYVLSSGFRGFVDDNFVSLYKMIFNSVNLGSSANGSNERVAMVFYALKQPNTYLFGKGLGYAGLYQAGVEGFRHFGQADLGTLLILGGIWFTGTLIYSYVNMLNLIIAKKKANLVVTVGIVAIVLLVTAYTQCVTRTNCTMCLILIALALRYRFGIIRISSGRIGCCQEKMKR